MNNDRRNRINKLINQLSEIAGDIEDLQSEESEAFENLPEGLQESDRGQAMDEAVNALQEARDYLDNVTESLQSATGN